jgi:DNA-binding CsgD family transcriptional regulator
MFFSILLVLGFDISEPTVSRYLQRLKRMPDESKSQAVARFSEQPS